MEVLDRTQLRRASDQVDKVIDQWIEQRSAPA
jgi:hypothetical protein